MTRTENKPNEDKPDNPDKSDKPDGPGFLMNLKESEENLRREADRIVEERTRLGLEGLVGVLQAVIINTEPQMQEVTVEELLRYTGLHSAFQDSSCRTCVLKVPGAPEFRSADFLIRSRLCDDNPFKDINVASKSRHLPNTRLETFVFETGNIERYVSIQKSVGVKFLTNDILDFDNYYFIQTEPSEFTGNSLGFIEWKGENKEKGDYASNDSKPLDWSPKKPDLPHLKNIKWIDHAATRVKAQERDAAIKEFLRLTNYKFNFAIYVESYNSITSVARLSHSDFAMVFTSGISPYVSDEVSGPTEKFIHNYGKRVHHIAFQTEQIEDTFQALLDDGMKFLLPLVGSPEEGLKQTFTEPSQNTLLVTEYIHRYGDFDGFFTKSNVTLLTAATGKQ
jgi:hypothetical protein